MRGDESCDEDTEDADAGDEADKRGEVGVRMPGQPEPPPAAGGGGPPPPAGSSGRQGLGMSRSVSDTTLRKHALHLNLSQSVLPSFTPLHQFKVV